MSQTFGNIAGVTRKRRRLENYALTTVCCFANLLLGFNKA